AMALAIWQAPRGVAAGLSILLIGAHAIGCWPSVISRWNHKQPWALKGAPWQAALRIEPEEQYLGRVLPEYNVARMIERVVPAGARVFSPDAVSDAYTSREVIVSYQSALGETLMDDLLTPVLHDFGPVWSIRFEWPPRELAGLRLVETGSDEVEQWSIHEVLLFAGASYVVPKPDWLLRSRPNGWDAALATDGNPATRWRSWWPLYPGMQYQVDFPKPLRLSAVELHCSSDQEQLRLRLEGRDPQGRWEDLPASMRRSDREPQREEMKRLAAGELKRQGVGYLLTDLEGGGMNVIAPDIANNPASWGVEQVAAYGPVRLYRID
ncbi:MAG TPA: discoidin domain-containing protein, partial [Bryobacterales bacterium]|nr:discoidin domain-containing protein [Bryobacterales bacterium]